MRKRFLLPLLVLLMTTLSIHAYDFQSGDLYYNITGENTVEVTSGYYSTLTTVTIPETVTNEGTNYSVTGIGDGAFSRCSYLTSVSLPNSLTTIGKETFSNCSGLTSITIPNSVTNIGKLAFSSCSALTSVTIGNSVTSIEYYTFSWCSSLTSISIPESVTSIGQSAFDGCSALSSIILGNSIVTIENYAFRSCSSLVSIDIPESVTSIGDNALEYCSSLTSITLPNSVTNIGGRAFAGCSALTSITIPYSVTNIGSFAFADCSALTSVVWNAKNCADWGESSLFYGICSNITSFIFGEEVETIPSYLCYDMSSLTSITTSNSLTSIGDRAFYACSSLTSITIPNSVTHIGDGAFGLVPNVVYNGTATGSPWGARSVNGYIDGYFVYADKTKKALLACYTTAMGEISIPNSVTSIGNYGFLRCSNISHINIPESVTQIGKGAFYNCTDLTSITIPNSVTSLGEILFYNCSTLASITIPSSVTSIGESAFSNCTSLTKTNYTGNIADWCAIQFNSSKANPIYYSENLYINDVLVTELIIPEGVKKIGHYVFYNDSALTSVSIPNSVTDIGSSAFYGCSSLTSLTIPNSVTDIGSSAFSGCSSLTSLTIPNSVTDIRSSAFSGCSSLTSLTIPNSVTKIEYGAFNGCSSFISITIPNSVTSIGNNAFYNVANIMYDGTATGAPWGARSMNGYVEGYLVFESDAKTKMVACSAAATGEIILPESVNKIGNSAFYGCKALTSITIPSAVTSIGENVFSGCSALTSIVWNVKKLGVHYYPNGLFGNITSHIKSFVIGEGVSSIPGDLCEGMSSLTSITIPESITYIGDGVFDGCSSLTSVIWNAKRCAATSWNNYSTYYYGPFSNISSQITSFTIGKEVDSIPAYLCYGMNNLSSITIPTSVTSIGEEVFYGCSSLTSVIWNAKQCAATSWETGSSYNKTYYYGPFANIKSQITSFIIGKEVENVPSYLCYGMSSLDSVTALSCTPPSCGSNVFYNTPGEKTLIVPSNSFEPYKSTYPWKYFTSFEKCLSVFVQSSDSTLGVAQIDQDVDCDSVAIISATATPGYQFTQWSDGNTDNPRTIKLTQDTILTAEFGLAYSGKCGDDLYWAYSNKEVKITGTGAMYNYTDSTMPWTLLRDSIKTVRVGNNATSIGEYAFANTPKLAELYIGANVEDIGANAFTGCKRLYQIYSYPTYPPFAKTSSFATYNAYLYIPCENSFDYEFDEVWGQFTRRECIGSEDVVVTDDEVVVAPSYEDVTITWPIVSGADTYSLVLTKEGDTFCTLVFNAQGQLVSIAFKPARQNAPAEEGTTPATYAEQTANGFRFTVTGLDEGTDYAYTLTVRNASNSVLETYTGEFTTLSNTPTGISDRPDTTETVSDKGAEKLLRDGQVLIIRNGETYDMMGQRL